MDVVGKQTELLDFDDLDEWAPRLAAALNEHIPVDVGRSVAAGSPVYIEDARDILFQLAERNAIVDAMLEWVRVADTCRIPWHPADRHGSRRSANVWISAPKGRSTSSTARKSAVASPQVEFSGFSS